MYLNGIYSVRHLKSRFKWLKWICVAMFHNVKKWGNMDNSILRFNSLEHPFRPSVSALFPDSNLNSFWLIFFKLCMDIDIGEEWFGIANGLNLFINNRVMALDWCKNVFFLNIFRTNGWIVIKICICIDKYKINVVSNAHYFWSIFLVNF